MTKRRRNGSKGRRAEVVARAGREIGPLRFRDAPGKVNSRELFAPFGCAVMKRHLSILLLVLSIPAVAAADGATLASARQRLLHGNIDEAIAQYEELSKDAKQKPKAAAGLSRCYEAQGEYDKALAVVDDALKTDARTSACWLGGRSCSTCAAAGTTLRRPSMLLSLSMANAPGPLGPRPGVARSRRPGEGEEELGWFTSFYNDNDINDPDDLYTLGLAGSENARWNMALSDQFKFILTSCTVRHEGRQGLLAGRVSGGPAPLGEVQPSRSSRGLRRGLDHQPQRAGAVLGKAMMALDRFELEKRKTCANALSTSIRTHPEVSLAGRHAHHFRRLRGRPDGAGAARAVNPRDEETLGRVAPAFCFRRRMRDFDAAEKDVKKHDT